MKQATEFSLMDNVQIFKALGDEIRLKILALLNHGELCVCDIMEVLDLPQSTVSRHLAYLKNSRWAVGRRSGKWMYYRLDPDLPERPVQQSILDYIATLPALRAEREKLRIYLIEKENKARCA